MKMRLLALLSATVLALVMVLSTMALADTVAQGDEDDETLREQAAALAAEAAPARIPRNVAVAATATLTAPLFVGVNDSSISTYVVDPADGMAFPLFDGYEVWGAAYDRENQYVYIADGSQLIRWPIGGTPALLGSIYSSAVTSTVMSIVGLAFNDGTLYGSRNVSSAGAPEGVYTIDTSSLLATLAFSYDVGIDNVDAGGLAFHPETGILYGANDDSDLQGLIQMAMDGTTTLVAPYPPGQTDLDGLAIGDDNRAYLVPDDPGDIIVFDFDTMTYTASISSPWATTEIFAGATWVVEPPTTTASIALTKTVGLDSNTCGASQEMLVVSGTAVTYCYEVVNTGAITLTNHDLDDDKLGPILSSLPFTLTPGASVFVTQTAALTQTTANTATWTASNPGPSDVVSDTDSANVLVSSLAFSKTVGIDPNVCAGSNSIIASLGAEVTYCYYMTNTGDVTYTTHTVNDSHLGALISDFPVSVTPGSSAWFTHSTTISQTTVNTATWTSWISGTAGSVSAEVSATVTISGADIAVSPSAITATVPEDSMAERPLVISSTGTADLDWFITEGDTDCSTTSTIDWLSVSPEGGTTLPGEAISVTVTMDATGLAFGTYEAALCVRSSVFTTPEISVPVTMTVMSSNYLLYIPYGSKALVSPFR